MGQFAVYRNKNPRSKATYPYLLDIQTDLLAELKTTVVIPLCPINTAPAIIAKLCPVLEIDSKKFVAFTQQLAGIERKQLGKEMQNLAHYRADILAALDFMISGI